MLKSCTFKVCDQGDGAFTFRGGRWIFCDELVGA